MNSPARALPNSTSLVTLYLCTAAATTALGLLGLIGSRFGFASGDLTGLLYVAALYLWLAAVACYRAHRASTAVTPMRDADNPPVSPSTWRHNRSCSQARQSA